VRRAGDRAARSALACRQWSAVWIRKAGAVRDLECRATRAAPRRVRAHVAVLDESEPCSCALLGFDDPALPECPGCGRAARERIALLALCLPALRYARRLVSRAA